MDETIKQANDRLAQAFQGIGFVLEPTGGVIDGTKVYDGSNRYLFAWQRNPHHILFYLRRPALDLRGTLRQAALSRHAAEKVSENMRRETTIRLDTDGEAETLVGWLLPRLPL